VGQLYNFVDKGEREVALRPEMTPTLARVVAARANGLRKPIRWYSIPQLFRYERQQRGRLREHFQLNCDLIGEPGPLGDAEIIALAIDIMRAFGLGPQDVRIRLSDRRVLNALLQDLKVPTAQLPLAYQALDKLGRRDYADLRRQVIADGMDAGVLDQLESLKNVRTWEQFQQAKGSHAGAIAAGNQLGQTITALHSMGLEEFLDFDLTIVRGIAYYTGTVFELFDAKRELRAICGGGRYDNLLSSLGGVDLPAVGFGMGDVVLGELLKDRGLAPPLPAPIDVLVAGITEQDLPHVLQVTHELRDGGIRVEYALSLQPVGKQLKLADAREARFAVLIGPDDRAKEEVVIKDLRTKEQTSLPASSVAEELKRRLNT